jgi:hypothetical protein
LVVGRYVSPQEWDATAAQIAPREILEVMGGGREGVVESEHG